ncbi:MAG: GAF domain-containing sensor histidine kinase [Anaerolineales bacterium]|jgi:signal transduction histidine kinase
MYEEITDTLTLRPQELEAVYAISRAVARAVNMDSALDEIIRLARPVFIFDNMVLYLPSDTGSLEPAYAKAIGRGRNQEAELAWGEATADEAISSGQVVIRKEEAAELEDRMRLRYLLGLPIHLGEDGIGALVFIRFGGPSYEPDHIRLAEFIAGHVAQLFEHDQLVQRVASLEAERRLDRLQEDFIATVSHELLTPLGFIKGYATTLMREDTTWDDSTRSEFLTIIDEEADRLHELIDNLMDSSRLQAGTLRMSFQQARLDTFLRDISLRAQSRDESQAIDLEVDAPGLKIAMDPARLAQVFDNLLTNASKYAPEARITISLDVNDRAHIQVSDDGPGIAPDHLEHIFKRFYRVPASNTTVRGTGLGLFICRQIVEAHGGEIGVDSKLGKGTTFHIYLPLNRAPIEEQIS